jgi:uncharacterized Zn finger protein
MKVWERPNEGTGAKKAGSSGWGRRWLAALETIGVDPRRLERGQKYARAGEVSSLHVEAGLVTAWVAGNGPVPCSVAIRLAALDDRVWTHAVAVIGARPALAARLLAGDLSADVESAFVPARLFPVVSKDLATSCSCPDTFSPCKHVAATHHVLAEAFDADPFLLLELRGRGRMRFLEGLARWRAEAESPVDASVVAAAPMAAIAFETPRAPAQVPVHLPEAPAGGGLLRQLGPPPVADPAALAAGLQALVSAAGRRARELALAEPPAPSPAAKPRPRGRGPG